MSVRVMIIFAFYIVGAFATTDILRLLKGSQISVWAKDCYCPVCGQKILMRDQFPIFSYMRNKGKCRNCGSKIPFSDLFLEIFLFIFMSLITIGADFSIYGFAACVCLYEGVKLVYLLKTGHREQYFIKNLIVSALSNILIFTMIAFLFFLNRIV